MTGQNLDEFRKRLKDYEKGSRRRFPRVRPLPGMPMASSGGRRRRFSIPWTWMIVVVALGFAMKAFIVLRIGEDQYRGRLAAYSDPGISESIGVFVMQPDPLTLTLRDVARSLIKPPR
ncbi:MAG: hypothetical protein K8F59_06340 [Rhodobacteraceae bacterium]|nr:hypothetical protein [Paracoccaceae bacterium]